jgi:hypothetical protein
VGHSVPKTARNRPCPCGSGKKFKKCHGAVGQIEPGLHSALIQHVQAAQALEQQREKQQGLGRLLSFVDE